MAQNDPYLPDFQTVADGGSVTFDGSASSTGTAIINEIAGNFDVQIFIEESNDGGTNWTQVTQLQDANGNNTFSGSFHSQYNRVYVSSGERRLRIDDAATGGEVSVTGDER
jgi:hypothetical protein